MLTSCNDKVEEPLCGSTDGHVQGTETSRRDLGDENPADWTPAELEETAKSLAQDSHASHTGQGSEGTYAAQR